MSEISCATAGSTDVLSIGHSERHSRESFYRSGNETGSVEVFEDYLTIATTLEALSQSERVHTAILAIDVAILVALAIRSPRAAPELLS
ncbi:MAG: hypothetical protein JWN03_4104 [Nocardia sp.]|nr:hypothetical protein [Nocardia sp.]